LSGFYWIVKKLKRPQYQRVTSSGVVLHHVQNQWLQLSLHPAACAVFLVTPRFALGRKVTLVMPVTPSPVATLADVVEWQWRHAARLILPYVQLQHGYYGNEKKTNFLELTLKCWFHSWVHKCSTASQFCLFNFESKQRVYHFYIFSVVIWASDVLL
jgi:hypothetical protein